MVQEDQRNCNGGGIGVVGRSSKKPKQKRVPQRGLGVAQLEKIRLEEQQKRDAVAISASTNSLSPTKTPYLPLAITNFHHSNEPSSTTPSPLSLQQQQQQQDAEAPSTVPLGNSGGFEAGWPSTSVPGHGNVPKWWSSFGFDFDKGNFGVDPGLPIPPSLPFESNPNWSLPNWVQRTPQQHQSSSSVVKVGTSSTTVPRFLIEPPSNQNHSGSGVPVIPVDKTVGTKRHYPFSLDFPPAPAVNYNFSFFSETRKNSKTSCGNGSGFNFDASNSTSREVPFFSASKSEPNSKKRKIENENFSGDFLTLAPPLSPASCSPSKLKSPSTSQALHNQEYPQFEFQSCQGNVEDQIPTPPVYRQINQQNQPFYSFFLPEAKEEQIEQTPASIQNYHEVGESIDLNLKLSI
ncbi:uncharacterized protein LOC113855272 [Abrus precatorius]|uniref:Uncharacterized protein LOC113855272 n=1 Tax=Abrus precatorius TaxID=3816 RepID=A0A8B8KHD0_ABRPR|nr:uncharacterized protein LOC113855272 [Abrus precatorius]